MERKQTFDEWAIVEMMGHQKIAGRVTEAEIGGSKFVRVDVPGRPNVQPLTKFLGPASIYAITPVSEETALAVAVTITPEPISKWDAKYMLEKSAALRRPLLDTRSTGGDDETDDDHNEDCDDDEIQVF